MFVISVNESCLHLLHDVQDLSHRSAFFIKPKLIVRFRGRSHSFSIMLVYFLIDLLFILPQFLFVILVYIHSINVRIIQPYLIRPNLCVNKPGYNRELLFGFAFYISVRIWCSTHFSYFSNTSLTSVP